MEVPKFNELMLPLLRQYSDRAEHRWLDLADLVADDMGLSEEQRKRLYPNTINPNRSIFIDRLSFARLFLTKAKLLRQVVRGTYSITERGEALLSEEPKEITVKRLKQYPDFWDERTKKEQIPDRQENNDETPIDRMSSAFDELQSDLEEALLNRVLQMPPQAFEVLVMRLLEKMGYGVGQETRYTKDGGIDGEITGDFLGFEKIYVQAKRWQGNVGRIEVSQFIGDISRKQAKKGIFITTSDFSKDAWEGLPRDPQVILVNGEKLVEIMIRFDLGVGPDRNFTIKKIDSDFFDEGGA